MFTRRRLSPANETRFSSCHGDSRASPQRAGAFRHILQLAPRRSTPSLRSVAQGGGEAAGRCPAGQPRAVVPTFTASASGRFSARVDSCPSRSWIGSATKSRRFLCGLCGAADAAPFQGSAVYRSAEALRQPIAALKFCATQRPLGTRAGVDVGILRLRMRIHKANPHASLRTTELEGVSRG